MMFIDIVVSCFGALQRPGDDCYASGNKSTGGVSHLMDNYE